MGIQAHFLQDKNQERFYPYGHAGAVYDKNGDTVQNRLDELDTYIENLTQDIENKAVQSDWDETDILDPAYIKNKPSSMPASDVYAWAKSTSKPDYTWNEIKSKPSTFTPSEHDHDIATSSKNGFMASTDKAKLDGIATGANKTTVDSALSSTSTNPVQNKVINSALSGKVPTTRTVNGKALSSNITLAASDVGAISTGQKGVVNGVAELDDSGKVPSAQLPSFVDDVVEGYLSSGKFYKESGHTTEINAESGKIYVDLSTNKTYRWSGSAYAEISASLALGETSTTAYRGDRGKIAYDHSQKAHAPSNAEANVQSDWSVSDTGSDAYIKNKPTSLPANGGNSSTVNGHSVQTDVPANAVFTDTKPVTMKGATSSTAGSAGYAPAPAAGKQSSFLRGDGTWVVPTNTNTTYTLTKSGSTITLTGSDGSKTSVADSNTTYSLSSFGVTATAAELNYMDGVSSNVQTQLNGKAPSSHTHKYAGSSSAGGAANSANKLNGTVLTNQNLNDYHSGVNFYYASGGNTCTNKPSGVDNFGMLVFQTAGGWWSQLLYGSDDDLYTRRWVSDSWTSWSKIYTTTNKPTASEIGAAAAGHTHSVATTSSNGFMSSTDKSKLDGIASGANKYTHPSYTAKSSGLYKVTVDSTGHVSATSAVTKSDITALGIPGSDTNTTYSVFKGATSSTSGGSGLVPAPTSGQQGSFLRADGTWANPANTTYSIGTASIAGLTKLYASTGSATDGTMTQNAITTALNGKASSSHTHNYAGSTSAGGSANSAVKLDTSTAGSATQPVYFSGGKPVACKYTLGKSVPSNAVFTDTNTWIALKGATTEVAGTAGYAPAPSAGAANRYLRSDGTWSVPPDTNTTYSNMSAATASAAGKAGLVPAPAAGSQTKYLRGDGTWQTPPNTTYSTATTSTSGLMSASDKSKLDGIASGANKYTLPIASSTTLGGVKTTSSVTSTSGLTACPIISGVPYYKDTNTTYTLSSFGITATAAELNKLDGVTATATELNYMDGVTSNVQTQLNGKANSTHTHNYAGSSSAGGAANSVKSSLIIKLNGGTTEGTNMVTFNGGTAKTINVTPSAIGAAASSHGTHVSYGSGNPKANGTASAGTATTVSRSDHVHPLQTTVSGNAGSATKLATARTIDGVSFNGSANITHFGTCSTAAATATKVVSCTGFTLASGAKITVKFTVTNTASNPTLNVNNTGAKAIMYRGTAISAGYLAANRVYTFVYDGTDYELIGDINTDTNTTYTTGTSSTSGLTKLYTSTGTNTDGTMTQDAITDALAGKASSSHNHSTSNITSGTLGVARGGTGVTANPSMLVNLSSTTAAGVFAASPRPGITGTLSVSHGGTGATTAAAARTKLGVTNIAVSTSEPTTQSNGDFWFKEI